VPEKYLHILLADDDPDDIEILTETFIEKQLRGKVTTATDGDCVLNLLDAKLDFDVLIIDISVCGITTGCLQKIKDKSTYRPLAILIWSTTISKTQCRIFAELGIEFFIEKPVLYAGYGTFLQDVFNNDLEKYRMKAAPILMDK
jgi:CheY-like chemotaxis protein